MGGLYFIEVLFVVHSSRKDLALSAFVPDSEANNKRNAKGKAPHDSNPRDRSEVDRDRDRDRDREAGASSKDSDRRGSRPRGSSSPANDRDRDRGENTSMRTRWDRAQDERRYRREQERGWFWSRGRGDWRYRQRGWNWHRDDRDHYWDDHDEDSILDYWEDTRRPLPCLIFVLPFLLIYELGVFWLVGANGEPMAIRTGADVWMRQGLAAVGLTSPWILPATLVVSLLVWQLANLRELHFRTGTLIGMAIESVIWALALIALSRGVDVAFTTVESAALTMEVPNTESGPDPDSNPNPNPNASSSSEAAATPATINSTLALIVGFVGAGIYEESLFRLALVPVLALGFRMLLAKRLMAATLAIFVSAAIFAIAHHAGAQGEAFSWYAFVFRCAAGVGFAGLFALRGFGIAVGAHIAYDVMVGWLGWHF